MRTSTWVGVGLALIVVMGIILFASQGLGTQSVMSEGDAPAGQVKIDLQTDGNGDGLPDELVAEIEQLTARFATDLDKGDQQEALAAIAELVGKLPLSDATLDTHDRAKELLTQQAATTDPDEKSALAQQVDQLLQDAESVDPAYQVALSTVRHMAGAQSGVQASDEIAPDFSQLQPGDILLSRGSNVYLNWFYAQHYSHAGIYDGNGMVYESNSDGVWLKPLAKWQEPGHQVALARINNLPVEEVLAALAWAKATYKADGSTQYNHDIPDKWVEDKLYCSQLVWKIIDHAGVDVDSNDIWYLMWITTRLGPIGPDFALPAVLPDEVAMSDHLQIYSSGVTK